MPRRSIRRTDFDTRVRNMLEIEGKHGIGGLSRLGGGAGPLAGLTSSALRDGSQDEEDPTPLYGTQADGPLSLLGTELVKQGEVIPLGAGGSWDADRVESPCVFYDPTRGMFGMVYVGYGTTTGAERAQVGLAWSDDLTSWSKDSASPIFSPSLSAGEPDQNGCSGPIVWREDGKWHLFYIGLTGTGYEGGTKTLCHATTTDADIETANWTRHGAVISPSGTGWRSSAIWHPNIVKRHDTYFLFFNATGTVGGVTTERIGYATSADLYTWTVKETHVLDVGPGWESDHIGDPSLMSVRMPNGSVGWVMAYYGYDGTNAYDGLAFTSDELFPDQWRKYDGNPILSPGGAGSIDEAFAHKPFRFVWGDRVYHYYTATRAGGSTRSIALAVAPLPSGFGGTLEDLTDVNAAPTKGTVLVGNGDQWVQVGPGTDGQALLADSTQASGAAFGDLNASGDETVFAPAYTVTDAATLDLDVTFVWGVDGSGEPYYNAAGVTAGDEAVLVLDNLTGEFAVRPVEV